MFISMVFLLSLSSLCSSPCLPRVPSLPPARHDCICLYATSRRGRNALFLDFVLGAERSLALRGSESGLGVESELRLVVERLALFLVLVDFIYALTKYQLELEVD